MLRREEGDILVHELSPQHFRQLMVAPDRAGAILQQRADDEKFDLVGDVFEIRAMAMLVQSDDMFALGRVGIMEAAPTQHLVDEQGSAKHVRAVGTIGIGEVAYILHVGLAP